MSRLVHSPSWMTEHDGEKYEYRYACGAAYLRLSARERVRTEHSERLEDVTCEACRAAVKERDA